VNAFIMKDIREGLTVKATSVVNFDGDGQYNVWVVDSAGIIRELISE